MCIIIDGVCRSEIIVPVTEDDCSLVLGKKMENLLDFLYKIPIWHLAREILGKR